VPSIKGVLISPPGYRADLVDISASGLLAEWGVPLKIGHTVTVTFEGTFVPASVQAKVVRSAVASVTPSGLRYHVALAFATPITSEEIAPVPPPTASDVVPDPASPAVAGPAADDAVNRW
jgi:hypothetical protein